MKVTSVKYQTKFQEVLKMKNGRYQGKTPEIFSCIMVCRRYLLVSRVYKKLKRSAALRVCAFAGGRGDSWV